MAFCANCGKEMKDGTKFCPSCGAPAKGKNITEENDVKGKLKSGAGKVNETVKGLPFRGMVENKVSPETRAKYPALGRIIPLTNYVVCLLALVIVVAVIAGIAGGGGGGGSRGGRANLGSGGKSGWPPRSVLNKYEAGRMPKPPGSGFAYREEKMYMGSVVAVAFNAKGNTQSWLKNWFSSNGWSELYSVSSSTHWQKYTSSFGILSATYSPASSSKSKASISFTSTSFSF